MQYRAACVLPMQNGGFATFRRKPRVYLHVVSTQPRGVTLRYLHTMVRIGNIDESLAFYCGQLGLEEVRRTESTQGRYTLVFLAAPLDRGRAE